MILIVNVIAWELPGFEYKYPKFRETIMQCEFHAFYYFLLCTLE